MLRWSSCFASSVVVGMLFAADAHAQQDRVDMLDGPRRHYESPQNFAIEVRFGPYMPQVDSDPSLGGKTPYKDTFGNSALVYVAIEFDWQVLRIPHFGTLGPGFGIGYANASGNALFQQEHNGTIVSGETTSLLMLPGYVAAVLRCDVLWREIGIPLEPYVKAGLAFAPWRASNTLGTSSDNGVTGEGTSTGTLLAAGLGFNLNVFDKYTAQNFDDELGINSTYIFAEGMRESLDGLGQNNALRVGSTNWVFGVNVEF
jgi:hypothetical protein